jgi:DNA-binding response OmpR family regulator
MTRLLIVDDEPSYRDYLARYLSREGYEVRSAANRDEALRVGREFEPHIVLADWMLKDQVHGLQVGEALRELVPGLRILLMTGFPSSEIRDEARRARVHRFLQKPFGLGEIKASVESAAAEILEEDGNAAG